MAFLTVACNIIGLVFLGMEHSLQLLLASTIVLGLIRETQTREADWWLVAALVAAPLIRYEDLFLAGPAIVFLFFRSHRGKAVVSAGLIAVTLGAFSAYLSGHQSGFLPTSVMAKSGYGGLHGVVGLAASTLRTNLESSQGALLALAIPILAAVLLDRTRDAGDRSLAAVVITAIAIHLCFGKTGGFGRYESYIWGAAILTNVHLHKNLLNRITLSLGHWRSAVVLAVVLTVACLPYTSIALLTPLASNNIYEQQYQMHRFATEYVDDVVAVNDLGYVSYGNPHYVLDLAGLASREALIGRSQDGDDGWMQRLTDRYGVKVVMIYDDWFESIPESWTRVGELRLGTARISPSRSVVSIYVVNKADSGHVRELLARFASTVPHGVEVRQTPE